MPTLTKIFPKNSDEILTQKIKFDAEFQSLSFSLETPDYRLEDGNIDKCLTIFIEQLLDAEEKPF